MMLFVFLALYVALGVASLVLGVRKRRKSSVVCGVTTLALALASIAVWVLSVLGASHWTVSVLQVLLSPMPESLLDPGSLDPVTQSSGVPPVAMATAELLVALALWTVPILGIVSAGRARRDARA